VPNRIGKRNRASTENYKVVG